MLPEFRNEPLTNFEIPENAVLITSIADGFIWTPWLFMALGRALGYIGLGIIFVVLAAGFFFYLSAPEAWERAAGGHYEEPAAMPIGD